MTTDAMSQGMICAAMILPGSYRSGAAIETTKLSTKGQIILPKAIRDANRWRPGTEFRVEEVSGGVLLRPAKPFASTSFDEVSGRLRYRGKPKSIEEMDRGIQKMVSRRRARGRY